MIFNPIVTGITSGIHSETIINPNSIISINDIYSNQNS